MRRLFSGTALALIALVLLSGTTFAGGWASAVLDDDNQEATAGHTATVGFTLFQHAKTRVSWPTARIAFTKQGSTEAAVFAAKATGPTGHYTADVKLPSAGSWSMRIETEELQVDTVLRPIAVKAPAVAAAPVAPAAVAQPAPARPAAPPQAPVAQPAAVAPTTTSVPIQPAPSSTVRVLLVLALLIAGMVGAGLLVGRRNGRLGRRGGTIAGR